MLTAIIVTVLRRPHPRVEETKRLFLEALQIRGLSREKAALWGEISRQRLDHMLSPDGHLSMNFIAKMPDDVVATFAALLLDSRGLPAFLRRANTALLTFDLLQERA